MDHKEGATDNQRTIQTSKHFIEIHDMFILFGTICYSREMTCQLASQQVDTKLLKTNREHVNKFI